MPNFDAESNVHQRKPSETMKLIGRRFWRAFSKSGFMPSVALVKGVINEMEGSLSVLSIPGGISGMFSGKGMSITETVVSEMKLEMNGRFAGVVMMVTAILRLSRRRVRWSSGMMWPLDMKGNRTACGIETQDCESILSLSLR